MAPQPPLPLCCTSSGITLQLCIDAHENRLEPLSMSRTPPETNGHRDSCDQSWPWTVSFLGLRAAAKYLEVHELLRVRALLQARSPEEGRQACTLSCVFFLAVSQ